MHYSLSAIGTRFTSLIAGTLNEAIWWRLRDELIGLGDFHLFDCLVLLKLRSQVVLLLLSLSTAQIHILIIQTMDKSIYKSWLIKDLT